MLFSRKNPATWLESLRVMLWPRRSWTRSVKYFSKRVLRLTATPHAIAAGIGAGVFASFTPFVGFHFVIAFLAAYLVAGNFLAAATGTFFGNPFTFPIIWTSTHKLGLAILSDDVGAARSIKEPQLASGSDFALIDPTIIWESIFAVWEPVFKPMLVGSVPLGVTFGLAAYFVTRWASTRFNLANNRRRQVRRGQTVDVA